MGVEIIPSELLMPIRSMFVKFFGGIEKMDCWLTKTSDMLSNPNDPKTKPVEFNPEIIPIQFQSLMQKPKEIVDVILYQMDALSIFEYQAKIIINGKTFSAIIIDKLSGHIMEEIESPNQQELSQLLLDKYGPSIDVVKE